MTSTVTTIERPRAILPDDEVTLIDDPDDDTDFQFSGDFDLRAPDEDDVTPEAGSRA